MMRERRRRSGWPPSNPSSPEILENSSFLVCLGILGVPFRLAQGVIVVPVRKKRGWGLLGQESRAPLPSSPGGPPMNLGASPATGFSSLRPCPGPWHCPPKQHLRAVRAAAEGPPARTRRSSGSSRKQHLELDLSHLLTTPPLREESQGDAGFSDSREGGDEEEDRLVTRPNTLRPSSTRARSTSFGEASSGALRGSKEQRNGGGDGWLTEEYSREDRDGERGEAQPSSSRGWGWTDTQEASRRLWRDSQRGRPGSEADAAPRGGEGPAPRRARAELASGGGAGVVWRAGQGRTAAPSGSRVAEGPSRQFSGGLHKRSPDGPYRAGGGPRLQREQELEEAEVGEWREDEGDTEDWRGWAGEEAEEEWEESGRRTAGSPPENSNSWPARTKSWQAPGLAGSREPWAGGRVAEVEDGPGPPPIPLVGAQPSSVALPAASAQSGKALRRRNAEGAPQGAGAARPAVQPVPASAPPDPRDSLNCQHFSVCSGCSHSESLSSPPIAEEAQLFMASCGVHSFRFLTPLTEGWRCRAKLVVRGSPEEPVIVGLYEQGTHEAVNIPECKAHHPRLNEAAQLVRDVVRSMNIPPYNEDTGAGRLRYVQLVLTTHNTSLPMSQRYAQGRVQVSLVWNARDEKAPEASSLMPLAQELWRRAGERRKKNSSSSSSSSSNSTWANTSSTSRSGSGSADSPPLLHSIWANFQTSRSNVIFGNRWRHMLGDMNAWEQFSPGIDSLLVPGGFGQANYKGYELLLRLLRRCVPHKASVTELYAGAGIVGISLAATRECRRVRCVEINRESQSSFEQSLQRLHPAVRKTVSWHCADASQAPGQWVDGAEVVVVDPPRKGLEEPVLEALRDGARRTLDRRKNMSKGSLAALEAALEDGSAGAEGDLQALIYVSCGWDAFKRDCAMLTADGLWHLSEAVGINFFPGTNSLETLALFHVGKRPKRPGAPRLLPPEPASPGSSPTTPRKGRGGPGRPAAGGSKKSGGGSGGGKAKKSAFAMSKKLSKQRGSSSGKA